jgi:uncharacterized protein YprB with RNaseH-like and TPR domain
MPSLSEKLEALGVKLGARELSSQSHQKDRADDSYAIEKVLNGSIRQTHQGEVFAVETRYPEGQAYGKAVLSITASLQVLGAWAGDTRLRDLPSQAFAFLDTETTGLSGGTGTYAFLIGVGRFEGNGSNLQNEFHLAQFFMRDPIEEPAQLAALEEFLAPCQAIVTFNGKAFDVPLLSTRYAYHGWQTPFSQMAHVDLLHLSRRLWRERLSSRTLSNLEAQIMGTLRSQEDIPGWMIPSIYFDYLRDGDARPLQRVFYHNAMDVLSLAALLDHTANLLTEPLRLGNQYSVDLIALARLFEELGEVETAAELYLHGLEHEDVRTECVPRTVLLQAIQRLALIHKRKANWPSAIQLWKQAARYHYLYAHLELAKCYEHNLRDIPEAIYWSQSAIELLQVMSVNENPSPEQGTPSISTKISTIPLDYPLNRESLEQLALTPYQRRQWLDDFHHRLSRLQRKLSGS